MSNYSSDVDGGMEVDFEGSNNGGNVEDEEAISSTAKRNEEIQKELASFLHSSDPHVIEITRKVTGIFGVFDRNNQRIIDVRDVGCIIRALGLFPTESDVHEIIQAIEEPSPQGFVKYERFVPFVARLLLDGNRFQPPPKEKVRKAFESLDTENQGYLDPSELRQILTKKGEKFTQEEVDKFIKFAVNPEDNKVHWESYLKKINFA